MAEYQLLVWRFEPESDACGVCASMAGVYSERPTRPHMHCQCSVIPNLDACELASTWREEHPVGQPYTEVVAYLQPKGSAQLAAGKKTISAEKETSSASGSWGITIGGSSEVSTGDEESRQNTEIVNHNPGISNGQQVIMDVYQEYQILTTKEWYCHDAGGFMETTFTSEARRIDRWQLPSE